MMSFFKKKNTADSAAAVVNEAVPPKKLRKPLVKTFDLYIIRKFLGSYVFSIVLLLAIVVMFDIN